MRCMHKPHHQTEEQEMNPNSIHEFLEAARQYFLSSMSLETAG
jgi:hypothetical protein